MTRVLLKKRGRVAIIPAQREKYQNNCVNLTEHNVSIPNVWLKSCAYHSYKQQSQQQLQRFTLAFLRKYMALPALARIGQDIMN